MTDQPSHPTPYPEANMVLNVLLPEVQAILGDQFIGMYLYGSLAYGGFDRESDVDFVVVTENELPEVLFLALKDLHMRIALLDSWCAIQLEGSYIPRLALKTYDPQRVLHLHIDRGRDEQLQRMRVYDTSLSHAWWGGWVLLRAVLWESGIPLAGPPPRTLLDPVTPDELKRAALAVLHGWAEPLLEDPDQIKERGYQSYFVLTMCRILYTLEFGAVTTKQAAARWAQVNLDERWIDLIERAWDGRRDPQAKAHARDIQETQELIRYALDHTSYAEKKKEIP